MTLGDIFDRLFKLIGKTWLRNIILASIILILPSIAMILGLDAFFSNITVLAGETEMGNQPAPEELFSILGSMVWFLLALFIFLIGTATATLSVTMVACAEMGGQRITWQEALRRTFGMSLVRLLGQYVLQGLVFVGLFIIPYLLLIAAIAVESIVLGLLTGLLLFSCILLVIYLATGWAFTVPAIGWEEARVIQSLRRSWRLVKGNWWRVFGILLLMSIIVSFAVSLVMTPVYLIALWDFFVSYFQMLGSVGWEEADPSAVFESFSSLGFGMGLVSGLSSILQMLVGPLYTTVLYFDLRARKGEFRQASSPATATV